MGKKSEISLMKTSPKYIYHLKGNERDCLNKRLWKTNKTGTWFLFLHFLLSQHSHPFCFLILLFQIHCHCFLPRVVTHFILSAALHFLFSFFPLSNSNWRLWRSFIILSVAVLMRVIDNSQYESAKPWDKTSLCVFGQHY